MRLCNLTNLVRPEMKWRLPIRKQVSRVINTIRPLRRLTRPSVASRAAQLPIKLPIVKVITKSCRWICRQTRQITTWQLKGYNWIAGACSSSMVTTKRVNTLMASSLLPSIDYRRHKVARISMKRTKHWPLRIRKSCRDRLSNHSCQLKVVRYLLRANLSSWCLESKLEMLNGSPVMMWPVEFSLYVRRNDCTGPSFFLKSLRRKLINTLDSQNRHSGLTRRIIIKVGNRVNIISSIT